jgi:hypothetical protein
MMKIIDRNRNGYYVEIRKDTIYFYTIAGISFSIILYVFLMVNEKQMKMKTEVERSKMLKRKANVGREGLNKVAERKAANLNRSTGF